MKGNILRCLFLLCLAPVQLTASDAIVRKHLTTVEYVSPGKVTLSVYAEVTVFNERGRGYSDFVVMYDPDKPVKKIGARLMDSNGKIVKTFKGKDVEDYPVYTESTLFQEYRHKQIEVHYPSYPYTAIFEYTQEYNDFISLPGWYPQESYGIEVEYASYQLTYSNNTPVRYMQGNLANPAESFPKDGLVQLFWEIKDLGAVYREPFSTPVSQRIPSLIVVPEHFTYKGVNGCYTNWGSYGSWVGSMVKGQDQLPAELVSKVAELTEGMESETDKVRAVYKFMQNTTRYVSIQLGIGGFKPASATEVFQNGWGDCKALVNYTKALLNSAGIDAYYCEIGVGNTGIIHDTFPSPNQTNHVILAVPVGRGQNTLLNSGQDTLLNSGQDTLWLECTNARIPFGYLPYSLQNQKVLWVDEQNGTGKIVSTPSPDAIANKRERFMEISIDPQGNASGKMKTVVTGGQMDWLFPELWLTGTEQNEIINRKYNSPGFRLVSAEYSMQEYDSRTDGQADGQDVFQDVAHTDGQAVAQDVAHTDGQTDARFYPAPCATEQLQFTIGNLASLTGNRMFIKTNLLPTIADAPAPENFRVSNVVSSTAFCHSDTLLYQIPDGYEIEFLPKPISLTTEYGTFTRQFTLLNPGETSNPGETRNTILCTSTITINRFDKPPTHYNPFVKFLTTITNPDYIILRK